MRITSDTIFQNDLANIAASTERFFDAQQLVTTGKQLSQPSDDPKDIASALNLQSTLDGIGQYQRNVTQAKGFASATDAALTNVATLITSARTIVLQGATSSVTADGRAGLAQEIQGIITSLGQIAGATYGDQHIFSGQRTTQPPFTQSASGFTYQGGSAATGDGDIKIEISPGASIVVNATGDSVFQQMFSTLQTVQNDLQNSQTNSLSTTDLDAMDKVISNITGLQASFGTKLQQINDTSDRLTQTQNAVTGQLSNIVDADLPQAMINLSTAQTAYQAALTGTTRSFQQSLLDFMK